MLSELIFLCSARDFHAMDWYRSARRKLPDCKIYIMTDSIEGEGYKKLINKSDRLLKLVIIDKLLCKKQSERCNKWRNIVKLLLLPIQVLLIRLYSIRINNNPIYYAHSMYYIWLAWLSGIRFVGTPQGSDILIKINKSKIYKFLSVRAMKSACAITVDSTSMKNIIYKLTAVNAEIVQNGIDIETIKSTINKNVKRDIILSIRGFTPLYRIKEIIEGRDKSKNYKDIDLTFIYPFYDENYKNKIKSALSKEDRDIGKVDRIKMYELMNRAKLAISIPFSDSSPRSVYEAIFCGCAVAITYNSYYEILPECMKERIVIVDIKDTYWFDKAMEFADLITQREFIPTSEALDLFDQLKSFEKIKNILESALKKSLNNN
jgi:hypothetical protein